MLRRLDTPRAPAPGGRVALLLLLGSAACSSGTDAPLLEVVSVSVEAPHPLVRALRVRLATAAPVTVKYGADDTPWLAVDSEVALEPALLLTGLRPGRAYRWRVVGTGAEGTFTTGPLPSDLAAVETETSGSLTGGWVLLHLYDAEGFTGYAAVDGDGEVRWYWRTADFPYGMTRRENGNFVFLDKARGLSEIAPDGRVVAEFPQDPRYGEMHHDVIASPSNTLYVVAFDDRSHDGATLRGDAILEWSPEAGTIERRWTSWDALDPEEDRGPGTGAEWLHVNALANGLRGNVLVSVHHLDQVLSLSSDWRTIEWRLGGVGATIPMPGDGRFAGQHSVREIAPDTFLLFDNSIRDRVRSRALEFTLAGGSASVVRTWSPTPPNFASAVGSARRTSRGTTVVGFGMSSGLAGSTGPIEAWEFSLDGGALWHLVVRGPSVMFRAEPIDAIGRERPAR